jgi:hypothetical protein
LPTNAKVPNVHGSPAVEAAAPSGASSQQEQLQHADCTAGSHLLDTEFVCSMFLARPTAAGAQPQLYTLSKWANGRAGVHLQHESWVQASRQQVGVRCGMRCVKRNGTCILSMPVIRPVVTFFVTQKICLVFSV